MPDEEGRLRAAVIIDYQNVYYSAMKLFCGGNRRKALIDPGKYADQLVDARNSTMTSGHPAVVARVEAFRGLPSADHEATLNAQTQAQASEWTKDRRVTVRMRPLRYSFAEAADGTRIRKDGNLVVASREEKGIDVLSALAMVRAARDPEIDLVILCSQDTDLVPAIEEVLRTRSTRVETAHWHKAGVKTLGLQPDRRNVPWVTRLWSTRLDEQRFAASRDKKWYAT